MSYHTLKLLCWTLSFSLFLTACQSSLTETVSGDEKQFSLLNSKETGIDFNNVIEEGKDFNILNFRNYYNGGGVAIGDINGDGLQDIFFTANLKSNKLYLNKGGFKFEDITEKAGVGGTRAWSTGVTMADINGDGLLDIYVCNSGNMEEDDKVNELFINKGNLTFTEEAETWGLNSSRLSQQSSFFDYDLDGDLDCFLLNNSLTVPNPVEFYEKSRKDVDSLGGDRMYRNDGNYFTDVTLEAGIYTSDVGFGLGISVSDLTQDMLPDIYVSNDFWERDYLYVNQGDGTFTEELENRLSLTSLNSMGTDIADLNNDGAFDMLTTDMLPPDNFRIKTMTVFDPWFPADSKYRAGYHYQILQNSLQLNDGTGKFQEMGHLSGVASTDWSWGALIFDFDNDGWKDIYISNAIYHDVTSLDFSDFISDRKNIEQIVKEKGSFDWRDLAVFMTSNPLPNYAFINELGNTERNGTGEIPSFTNKASELGLGEPSFSNGAAYGDLDNDGDLDLVVNNLNMEAFVFKNNASGNYLKIILKGKGKNVNGVGARVWIKYGHTEQVLQNYPSRSFESSVGQSLVFGLGENEKVDELEVIWANHDKQILRNLTANQVLVLDQSEASEKFAHHDPKAVTLFKEVKAIKGNHKHQENSFNDFDHENLLPKMLSTEGPVIIKGDVNGDGLDDFILGGAANDPDKLFIQGGGGWRSASSDWQALAEADKNFETTCGAIFDIDGDGDKDIVLGAGGNEYQKGIESFFLRSYINNGSGNFSKIMEGAPSALGNFSCIIPEDMDDDGDMDLFIGGRVVPGNYGLVPRSFLLRNEGAGMWTDITSKEIGTAGMVTDAVWSDVDGDGDKDLIIVGDWMPIKIFENDRGNFTFAEHLTDKNLAGWWTAIEAADLDNDGDEDYVLGNWGLNSKLKASPDRPLTMYVKDFDNNGKSEFIINWFAPLETQAYPIATKPDMMKQIPRLKESNTTYSDYARKTYEILLPQVARENAIPYKATVMETSVLINQGSTLKMVALPLAAQVSPVFAIVAEDLDGDGQTDLWLGGNFHGLKPEIGYNNSSKGVFLRGDSGSFKYVSPAETGIELSGQVRDATIFKSADGLKLLIVRNDEEAVVYEKN